MSDTKDNTPGHMNVAFPITSLCREDLVNPLVGMTEEEAEKITDEQMQRIASKLADDYCEQLFWSSLKIIAHIFIKEE